MDVKDDVMSDANIVRPRLLWIGQRCFRLIGDSPKIGRGEMTEESDTVVQAEYMDEADNSSKNPWTIEMKGEGSFVSRMSISSVYYGYICGVKNTKKAAIEKETRTSVKVPKYGDSSNVVVITGSSSTSVDSACARIYMCITERRKKSGVTHFVSLPFNTEVIRSSFGQFKQLALQYPGIDEDLFQTPAKLHLTLGVLTLLDAIEIQRAKNVISGFVTTEVRSLTEKNAIPLKLRGLEIMGDDPTAVDVLYGLLEESEGRSLVQHIANRLNAVLYDSGYLTCNDYRNDALNDVKLHVTFMNSKFKKQKSEGTEQQGKRRKRYPFNATHILKNHGTFEFGCISAEQFHLCERGPEGPDGAHQTLSEHSFTSDEI